MKYNWVPATTPGMNRIEPEWLDIDQCGTSRSASRPAHPRTYNWTVNRPGRSSAPATRRRQHQPERGHRWPGVVRLEARYSSHLYTSTTASAPVRMSVCTGTRQSPSPPWPGANG